MSENSISNFKSNTFQYSKILGILPVADVMPMDTISYNNIDGGMNYNYKIHNKKISFLNLSITNEDFVEFPQISDYILTLQLIKHRKIDELSLVNKKLDDLNSFVTYIMSQMNI